MDINTLSINMSIHDSPFWKNDILKVFIEAYLLKPDLKFSNFDLQPLQKYRFGIKESSTLYQIDNDEHFDLFIGYRFILRKYRPFFLSINEYEDDEYEINGFSTLMDYDFDCSYYKYHELLPSFKNWNFQLKISSDPHIRPDTMCSLKNSIDSISQNLMRIAETTKKKNEKILLKNKRK